MSYRIRRCEEATDANVIFSLVKELAVYEKEPAAVKLCAADFRRELFEVQPPLACAALAEFSADDDDCVETKKWTAVGLVVWCYTFSTWEGRGSWLEDCMYQDYM